MMKSWQSTLAAILLLVFVGVGITQATGLLDWGNLGAGVGALAPGPKKDGGDNPNKKDTFGSGGADSKLPAAVFKIDHDGDRKWNYRCSVHRSNAKEKACVQARAFARSELKKHGMGDYQYAQLVKLWTRESHWWYKANNPESKAYGIPQSWPGDKMKMFGRDWRTNYRTQIKWGIWYIIDTYKTPQRANNFWWSKCGGSKGCWY